MLLRFIVVFFLLALPLSGTLAQDTTRFVATNVHLITTDELGNIYAVGSDNLLVRYNENGDSTAYYNSVLNGDLGVVDAMNPLRLLLFYPGLSKIILLDRLLTQQSEIDLHIFNIPSGALAAAASDNAIWVYDPYASELRKIDENGRELRTSNDLRQQLNLVPQPSFLIERERKVYLADSMHGILVFDQFGSYLNTLPIKGISSLQVFGEQVVYLRDNTLYSYNMKGFTEQRIPLSVKYGNVLGAAISTHKLVVLYKKGLAFYKWPLKS